MRERKNQSNACWISKLNAGNVIVMLLFSAELCILHSQILPYRTAIVEKMTIANSKYMKMWPDPTEPSLPHIAFEWTYATYFVGDMAMYAITLDSSYYNYAVRWAEGLKWEMRNWPDFQMIGQTFVELYQWDPKPERIESVKTWAEGKLGYDEGVWYGWIDPLMIAWPTLPKVQAALYNNNDTRYAEAIYNIFNSAKTICYNATDHLWWRDESFKPPYTEPNGEDCYWSRGNGWVFSGLVRVLDVLPESYPHREEYIRTFIEMAEALRLVQRTDGFWNVSLHDSTHFGGPEETGTAFFTYGIAWGIRKGLLDSSVFLPTVLKAWDALANTALRSDSILGYYQGTGDQPESGQPVTLYSVPNFYDYGVGGFLLAGSEMVKLVDWLSISGYLRLLLTDSANGLPVSGAMIKVSERDGVLTLRGGSNSAGGLIIPVDTGHVVFNISKAGYYGQENLTADIVAGDTVAISIRLARLAKTRISILPEHVFIGRNERFHLSAFNVFSDGYFNTLDTLHQDVVWSMRPSGFATIDSTGWGLSLDVFGTAVAACSSLVSGLTGACSVTIYNSFDNILYYWPLDEGSGAFASDSTGHGNTAAFQGAPEWVAGKYSGALAFDGVNDYLSTALSISVPNFITLSLWFKTTTTTGGKLIGFGNTQTGQSGSYGRHLYMNNAGKIYFSSDFGGENTISTPFSYNDDCWHHAAATFSSEGMMLYVDGALQASNPAVISSPGGVDGKYCRIGFDNIAGWPSAPSSYYFSGQLDDIRVYDIALSASDIASLYGPGTENEPVIITPENLALTASPNPFNPSARISYYLPQKAAISLTLYNPQGKMVKELVSGMVLAGRHTVQVDIGSLASGIYICELKSNAMAKRLKLVLMR